MYMYEVSSLLVPIQYGDDYVEEIEHLWTALCTWTTNIRVAINYMARLTCVAGNLSLMLHQVSINYVHRKCMYAACGSIVH